MDHIHPQSRIPSNQEGEDNMTLYHGLGNLVLVNGKQRDYQDVEPIKKAPLYKEGYLMTKCLTPIEGELDQKTKEVWAQIQSKVPYSLDKWDSSVIEKRRDYLIDEFISILPEVLLVKGI